MVGTSFTPRRLVLNLLFAASSLAHAAGSPVDVLVLTGGVGNASAADGNVRAGGYGRDFIAKLMQDAGLSYAIEPQPFARALKTLDTNPSAVLFPMLRTAARESQYQWVGLMAKRQYYLYRL
ncbi:MAG: hypothetical protein ABIZ09_06825, partial [Rhodoferax sp.]